MVHLVKRDGMDGSRFLGNPRGFFHEKAIISTRALQDDVVQYIHTLASYANTPRPPWQLGKVPGSPLGLPTRTQSVREFRAVPGLIQLPSKVREQRKDS